MKKKNEHNTQLDMFLGVLIDHKTEFGYMPGQRAGSKGPCIGAHGAATLAGGLHQCQTVIGRFGYCNWLRGGGQAGEGVVDT